MPPEGLESSALVWNISPITGDGELPAKIGVKSDPLELVPFICGHTHISAHGIQVAFKIFSIVVYDAVLTRIST